MEPEEIRRVLPLVQNWISELWRTSSPKAKPVASLGFTGLPKYYSSDLLARATVVFVDKCPALPLSAFGLKQFADFENMTSSGVTYLDRYFIVREQAEREPLHFHELVHVIQWIILGPERFLTSYARGLEHYGYKNSPLEVMAYKHEARFTAGEQPYSVEDEVADQLKSFQ